MAKSTFKTGKATTADAELIVKLYDLRREAEMRKARMWFAAEFWPNSVDDIMAVISDFGSQRNAWFRQLTGYWDMAASFVVRGALHADLFYDSGGEMWFVFAKIAPYINELRDKAGTPTMLSNVEKVAIGSKHAKIRLQLMMKRQAARKQAMAAGKQ